MQNNTNTSVPLKLILAFAIFWMFIGELISCHQKAIYGHDLFAMQHPFTKSKTGDDGGTTYLKTHKGPDKTDNSNLTVFRIPSQYHLIKLQFILIEGQVVFHNSLKQSQLIHFSGLRAPPSL